MVQQVKRPWVERAAVGIALVLLLAACATRPNRAPIEDRSASASAGLRTSPAAAPDIAAAVAVPAESEAPLPGAENAGKPGYYMVKPGETLIRIGLDNGQNWKDLVKWNNLENPNVLEVGQVLRIVPPGADPNSASARPVAAPRVETRPLDVKTVSAAGSTASTTTAAAVAASAAPAAPVIREGDDSITWSWPAAGTVTAPFQEGKAKGLDISGKVGEPVLAAADGRVVYAGSGLRGYGNLVILKHNATYLSAYAHNQVLLVKEDQSVRRGQKIAEMGSTDADGVQLHFEIRKQGKPIDPAKLLPPR